MNLLLAIESSCDECSASVVRYHPALQVPARAPAAIEVLSVATYSQTTLHEPYGGVVPEIASRNHLETINYMIDHALKAAEARASEQGWTFNRSQIEAIAVTNRPGLVGALLVGVSAAKALAFSWGIPLVPVHHLEGHAASIFLTDTPTSSALPLELPALLAIVSGGHTNLHVVTAPPELWPPDFLARTRVSSSRDDAAGEAFDKIGKVLGFPYPAGQWIDRTAQGGDPAAFPLPRAFSGKTEESDFSFSGLKTAAAQLIEKLKANGTLEERLADVCASVQESIIDQLLTKIERTIVRHGCRSLAVVGGVAANSRLRARLKELSERLDVRLLFPPLTYCTDNAAMIGAAGAFRWRQQHYLRYPEYLMLNAQPGAEI